MSPADLATLAAGLPAVVILARRWRSIRRRTADARAEYRAARRAAAVEHHDEQAARRYRATMRILAGKGWDAPTPAPIPTRAVRRARARALVREFDERTAR